MSQSKPERIQAPPGTFERLASIEDGRLGNPYTKRLLDINDVPPELTGEAWLNIRLRVQDDRAGKVYRYFDFGLTKDDVVVNLRASRGRFDERAEEVLPPPFSELLREISTAERIQPTLKR